MVLTGSQIRKLCLVSIALVSVALVGSLVAWVCFDHYPMDWPILGVMVATLTAVLASLLNERRALLRSALTWISIILTVPCSSLVLIRLLG